jgi:hypothetical protein
MFLNGGWFCVAIPLAELESKRRQTACEGICVPHHATNETVRLADFFGNNFFYRAVCRSWKSHRLTIDGKATHTILQSIRLILSNRQRQALSRLAKPLRSNLIYSVKSPPVRQNSKAFALTLVKSVKDAVLLPETPSAHEDGLELAIVGWVCGAVRESQLYRANQILDLFFVGEDVHTAHVRFDILVVWKLLLEVWVLEAESVRSLDLGEVAHVAYCFVAASSLADEEEHAEYEESQQGYQPDHWN